MLVALAGCNDAPSAPEPPFGGDVVLRNGVLLIGGTESSNQFRVTYSSDGVRVERDGEPADFGDPIRAIEVVTLGGDNVVRFDQTVVADLELSIVAGDGDDELLLSFAPTGPGDEMALDVDVDTGSGSNRLDLAWDGTAVPALVSYTKFVANGTPLRAEQGDEVLVSFEGGDANQPYVIGGLYNGKGSTNAPTGGDPRTFDLEVDFTQGKADVTLLVAGGVGPDDLDLEVDYSGVTQQQGRITLDADLSEGDNHVGQYILTSATHTALETSILAGDGDNVLDLENVLGGDGEQTFTVELGDGDNATSVRFGDGARGARPTTGARNVTATYRSGVGANAVEIDSDVVEPLASDLTIDFGGGQSSATGRYKLKFPWDRDGSPGSQTVPSQVKVLLLSPMESALDLTIDVGDPEEDGPEAFGAVVVQGTAMRQTDLDFIHRLATPTGAAPDQEWELHVAGLETAGDASLSVQGAPGLERLIYLQDAVEVGTGAALKVALQGSDGPDAMLAHLLGVSGAGRLDFLADGGGGGDILAALTRDLDASGGAEMTFDLLGGDGDDMLGLGAPAGLARDGPIRHAIAAGTGSDACFTPQTVPATDCDRREEIGEELLKLLETLFGVERVEVWRE